MSILGGLARAYNGCVKTWWWSRERKRAAEALYEAVSAVIDDNDNMGNKGPWLPGKWRKPLVKAANDYYAASGRKWR